MPIYEYTCEACGELTEALQKISDPLLRDCPHCGKPALKKKISAAAFRLKGGGWYETDFKSAGRRNVAGDGQDADKGGSKGGDTEGGSDKGGTPASGDAGGKASTSSTSGTAAKSSGGSEASG